MAYLESVGLVRILPCLAEPGKIIVVGKPSRPLDDVLPYLATLPGVIAFNPEASTLTFRRQPGFLTLQSTDVYITQVKDVDEGLELLAALTESINSVWEHRSELVPAGASKTAPALLEIWALLPRTNCRECGEQTCLAFAARLIQQERLAVDCPILQSGAASAVHLATLNAML